MSSTCLKQHPPSHLKPLAKNISLNKNMSDMLNRMPDRQGTHLILRYIAETGVGVGVGKFWQKKIQDGEC